MMKNLSSCESQAPVCLVLSILIHTDGGVFGYMNLENDGKNHCAMSIL